jgi:methylated-DNA-[protein]-cysteine S-methyltransferase
MKLNLSRVDSPLGELLLVTDQSAQLRALDFASRTSRIHLASRLHRNLSKHFGRYELAEKVAPVEIAAALRRYFTGDFASLKSIIIAPAGSELQRRVWAMLADIPAGKTASYGQIARDLGYDDPRMAIEVGAANGANPIAIVVPCHRVIGSGGDLKGYAWGLHRKRWLLEHEGAVSPVQPDHIPQPVQLSWFFKTT